MAPCKETMALPILIRMGEYLALPRLNYDERGASDSTFSDMDQLGGR
jgi:hypothetical protein